MALGDVNADILTGYWTQEQFDANPGVLLGAGQRIDLEQTGTYKVGDGVTALKDLIWLGIARVQPGCIAFGGTPSGELSSTNDYKYQEGVVEQALSSAKDFFKLSVGPGVRWTFALANEHVDVGQFHNLHIINDDGDDVFVFKCPVRFDGEVSGIGPMLPIWSGQWRSGFLGTSGAVTSGWAGVVYTTSYVVGTPHSVTQIRWPVTDGIAASNIRLALYDDLNGYPNNLIEQSGNVDSSVAGELSFQFSSAINLTGNLYHMALQASSNSVSGRYWAGGVIVLPRPDSGAPFGSYAFSQAFGAFPSVFPGGAVKANIGNQPMLGMLVQ